jgi:fructosamine-3-kinase
MAACWQRLKRRRESGFAVQQPVMKRWLAQQGMELVTMQPVGGGCIHRAWQLELGDGSRRFAKTNRAALLPVLAAEADGLKALAAAAQSGAASGPTPSIPQPLGLADLTGEAVLLLSWLDLGPGSPQGWQELGAGLARLHRASLTASDSRYGWHANNFIGSGPQANGWQSSWGAFWCEQRLGVQLQQAEAAGRPLPQAQTLLERVPEWLSQHQPDACLVHGDLWSGNASLLRGGGSALFDPAVYRGDREVDLAMARLFGGFPAAFFEGYMQEWPLPEGHRQRVELYNLYHLLNHANLFGGSYWQQSSASIQALLRTWS